MVLYWCPRCKRHSDFQFVGWAEGQRMKKAIVECTTCKEQIEVKVKEAEDVK